MSVLDKAKTIADTAETISRIYDAWFARQQKPLEKKIAEFEERLRKTEGR